MNRSSITLRFALVAGLALALLVPLLFVVGLVDERQRYYGEVMSEIAKAWGGPQSIIGPVLVVPEIYSHADPTQDHLITRERRRLRIVLPDEVDLSLDLQHEMRNRSIYNVPVFETTIDLAGRFDLTELRRATQDSRLIWPEARLVVGISDPQAIADASELTFGEHRTRFSGGTGLTWMPGGIRAEINLPSQRNRFDFNTKVRIKGTERLSFAQLGRSTHVKARATWPHPKFDGANLPTRHDIRDDGFSAEWSITELARSLPGQWIDGEANLLAAATSDIQLFQPTTPYTLVDRGIKYAVLFIALTFVSLLCFELRSSLRLHIVQFGVVGLALVLFYLTLLSLSEHIPFTAAYAVATLTLTAMIGSYTWSATRRIAGNTPGVIISVLLIALYGCLYVLLRLEAFALLVGCGVLLLGLGALMYATRDLVEREDDRDPTRVASGGVDQVS